MSGHWRHGGGEGTNEDDDSDFQSFVNSYFAECPVEESWRIREVFNALQRESEIDEAPNHTDHTSDLDYLERPFYVKPTGPTDDFDIHAHYVKSGFEAVNYGEPDEYDESGNPCVEVYFLPGMGKCLMDDSNLSENEYVVMQVLLSGVKTAVIQRDTDILTPQEIKQNH